MDDAISIRMSISSTSSIFSIISSINSSITSASNSDNDKEEYDEINRIVLNAFIILQEDQESKTNEFTINEKLNDMYSNLVSVFSYLLGCSILDISDFIWHSLNLTAICQSDWEGIEISTQSEKKNRKIVYLGNSCYHYTRFTQEDLSILLQHFFCRFHSNSFTFANYRV